MVQCGDFEVHLVEAETKTPFPEHSKDGKYYVEVEPNVEYFISIKKTVKSELKTQDALLCYYFVDGQDLGFNTRFQKNKVNSEPRYEGLWSRTNGISATQALKFTKPRITTGGNGGSGVLMGKVEIRVYEGVFNGIGQGSKDSSKRSFCAATVDMNESGASKKKNLRSGEGTTVIQHQSQSAFGPIRKYKRGAHIDTITLNYCAALGLIEVGVLPKPDMWTHHRMKRPAEPGQVKMETQPKKFRDVVDQSKEVELFDLSAVPSDDEGN